MMYWNGTIITNPRATQVLPRSIELDQDEVLGGDDVKEVVPRQH